MVVVIVVVFVLCWLPFFIINMVNLVVIIPESSVSAGIYFFAVILSYANSCANPVLYCFLSDNFKQSFRKVGGTVFFLELFIQFGLQACLVCPKAKEKRPGRTWETHTNEAVV